MSNFSKTPWSNSPNAPNIPTRLCLGEKEHFVGFLIDAILYGIVIVLFFRCIGAFFAPANRTMDIKLKWGLVAHTVAMFSFATVYVAVIFHIQLTSFVDKREFHASATGMPGPVEYQCFSHSKAIGIAPTPLLLFNNWLSGGIMIYRCYVTYDRSSWVVAFPCLMYFAALAMGVAFVYESSRPDFIPKDIATTVLFDVSFFSISSALNILVTILIVSRLLLHRKSLQTAMGAGANIGRMRDTTMEISVILVESYAVCAFTVALYLATLCARSYLQYIFLQIIAQVQVIAPFLVHLRVANRRVTSDSLSVPTDLSPVHFGAHGKRRSDSGTISSGYTMSSMDTGEPGIGDVIIIGHQRDGFSDSK